MINKNSHSYPILDISTYLSEFISQRKLFLGNSNHSMTFNVNSIQNEVRKIIGPYIDLNKSSPKLIIRLEKIIMDFPSLEIMDSKLILYLKRYFELHNMLYSELESKKLKLDTSSSQNDINILFRLSYLLQLIYIKAKDFNYLSTSIKINDYILNEFKFNELEKFSLVKYLINHEILILRNFNESI